VAATDALFAYRTNPHIDQWETGRRAADLLLRTVAGTARPVQAACWPPLAINIERQATSEPPLLALCAERDRLEQSPGLHGVSLLLGFPYADVAEIGSAVLVVTEGDRALAQRTAATFAQSLWNARGPLAGTFLSPADAVAQAATAAAPVCLLDMGDNVGGGSPADGTILAHELLRQGVGPAVVILYDPAAVQAAEALGVNGRGRLSVGGKTDDQHGPPLTAEFVVRYLGEGRFEESETRHGGFSSFDQGRIAIVATDAGLTVLLTSRRVPPFSLKQLTQFGIDPTAFRVLVAKGVNAPLAAYAPVSRTILRVNTPGVTTADMTQLPFHHRRRPLCPFERDFDWSPV
jgi:microcystin degradation protein MlrC